ncbi:phage tail-collar fiber domain-containing protein [Halomonas alkalicola]|uniref:phage tail-collar fiber domain-containing protein n=1 Tax=Halomonas alkalicola TaxID=1930622 RepID=UPI00265E4301|nr:phage tail protein [Halomonas alkalicola]
MAQFYTLLTQVGQAKLANAVALGNTIELTHLAVGDGGGSVPTPDSDRTALINEVRRAPINRVEVDADNPNWVVVEQVMPPDVGGWTIREIGVLDSAGDLIAYGNYPETYKPTLDEGSGRTQTVRMVLQVSDTASVTLKVDPSVVLATRGYADTIGEQAVQALQEHEEGRAHPAATTADQGMVQLATSEQARAGTRTDRAVHPAGLKAAIDQAVEAGAYQFAAYDADRIYTTGEIACGSDGTFYEFYDRDGDGSVQDVDPTDSANRPHIWMEWDGVKPGSTIEWRSETLPEGYVENDGTEISRADYRRIYAALGDTYGEGDGSTTFLLPDDRGEFKRGWDHGRGVDDGRVLAAHQSDELKSHKHEFELTAMAAGNNHDRYSRPAADSAANNGSATGSGTRNAGGSETRPRNNATIYLTKI